MMQNRNTPDESQFQNVSRETFEKLSAYVSLLLKWQKSINLVSQNTQDLWARHIEDSFQLITFLPDNQKDIIDLGSGGGLPGIVLAIAAPQHHYLLIESDRKKAIFLKEAARELALNNVTVENKRIEAVAHQGDIITSRALAELEQLLRFSVPLIKKDAFCLFLKGANWSKELADAQKNWSFHYEALQSITAADARILKIDHICRINR